MIRTWIYFIWPEFQFLHLYLNRVLHSSVHINLMLYITYLYSLFIGPTLSTTFIHHNWNPFILQKVSNKPYPFTSKISLSGFCYSATYHSLITLLKPTLHCSIFSNHTQIRKKPKDPFFFLWVFNKMEKSVSNNHHLHLRTMLTLSQPPPSSSASFKTQLRAFPKRLTVRASAGRRHCEFSSLNAPLEPRSLVGKFLGGVLQNRRQLFHVVAKEELKMLSEDRDSAIARMIISQNSDEALLHRFLSHSNYPLLVIGIFNSAWFPNIVFMLIKVHMHVCIWLQSNLWFLVKFK